MKKAREKPTQRTGSPKPAAAPPGGSPLGAKGDGDRSRVSNNSPRFRRIRILNKSGRNLLKLRAYSKFYPAVPDRVVNLDSAIDDGKAAHGHAQGNRSTPDVEVRIWTGPIGTDNGVIVRFSVNPADGCIEDLFVVVTSYRSSALGVSEALEVEALASYAVADDAPTVDKPFTKQYYDVQSLPAIP